MTAKKYRGVDIASLKYYIKEDSWDINPNGHLPKVSEKITEFANNFAEEMKGLSNGKITPKEAEAKGKKCNREILKLALIQKSDSTPNGFDFDETVEKYGWKPVDGMVVDLKLFLVDYGGQEEYQLLKHRSRTAMENGFHGIEI